MRLTLSPFKLYYFNLSFLKVIWASFKWICVPCKKYIISNKNKSHVCVTWELLWYLLYWRERERGRRREGEKVGWGRLREKKYKFFWIHLLRISSNHNRKFYTYMIRLTRDSQMPIIRNKRNSRCQVFGTLYPKLNKIASRGNQLLAKTSKTSNCSI